MPRIINDINYLFVKKPRAIIHYIDPYGKLIEYDIGELKLQGEKIFEIPIKGEERSKKWNLVYPPYKDELGRDIYVCPYNQLTNINFDYFDNNNYLQIFNQHIQPALDQEFFLGVEHERRRQEGKGQKKKKMPIFLILIIMAVVFIIVMIAMLGIIYFMG